MVSVIALGESFDASSRSCEEFPLLCPVLYIFISMLFSYPCVKMVEFHDPSFLFSMVFKSTRLVVSLFSCGYIRKVTLFDLWTICNSLKFEITN